MLVLQAMQSIIIYATPPASPASQGEGLVVAVWIITEAAATDTVGEEVWGGTAEFRKWAPSGGQPIQQSLSSQLECHSV